MPHTGRDKGRIFAKIQYKPLLPYLEKNVDIENRLFSVTDAGQFQSAALEVFRFQYDHSPVYTKWCNLIGRNPDNVSELSDIPFLPVELFKSHRVITESNHSEPQLIFKSSGTTGSTPSRHYVLYSEVYDRSWLECFRIFYGEPNEWRVLALLPSYLESGNSSLVHMVAGLIAKSGDPDSGFFLNNHDDLISLLYKPSNRKTLLIGVSYALLDLAECIRKPLLNTVIMETGGMKGRRRELTRMELHDILKGAFGVSHIHSEYGMTELLSQAYAARDGLFRTPPWMQISLRDANDPLSAAQPGKTGGINIIDLANLYSCSFIATGDLGRQTGDYIEILGRFDYSEMRGCNLMVSDL